MTNMSLPLSVLYSVNPAVNLAWYANEHLPQQFAHWVPAVPLPDDCAANWNGLDVLACGQSLGVGADAYGVTLM